MADPAFVLTLSGCDPYDGVYRISLSDPFTTGDLNIVKTISGVRSQELEDALLAGDTDVLVALAVIGLVREGKAVRKQAAQIAEQLWATADSLQVEIEGDEDGPPAPAAEAPQPVAPSESSASDSGSDSFTGSESPV